MELIERLRERASKVRQYIASSQLVVDLLKPEMDKFDARTGHDIYTVRMSVDHANSIKKQTVEADDLDAAATAIETLTTQLAERDAEIARLRSEITKLADYIESPLDDNVRKALAQRICCDGRECDCKGSDIGSYLAWKARQALGEP